MKFEGYGCCRYNFLTNQEDPDPLIQDKGLHFTSYFHSLDLPKNWWECQLSCEEDPTCIASDLRDNICTKFYGAGDNFAMACDTGNARGGKEMCWRKSCDIRTETTKTTTTVTYSTKTVTTTTGTTQTITATSTACTDFSGRWIDEPTWYTPKVFVQTGCSGKDTINSVTYSVQGTSIRMSGPTETRIGSLVLGDIKDTINWDNGITWERYKGAIPEEPDADGHAHRLHATVPLLLAGLLVLLADRVASPAVCS